MGLRRRRGELRDRAPGVQVHGLSLDQLRIVEPANRNLCDRVKDHRTERPHPVAAVVAAVLEVYLLEVLNDLLEVLLRGDEANLVLLPVWGSM